MGAEALFVAAVVLGITLLSAFGFLILNFVVAPCETQDPSMEHAGDKPRSDSYPPYLWH